MINIVVLLLVGIGIYMIARTFINAMAGYHIAEYEDRSRHTITRLESPLKFWIAVVADLAAALCVIFVGLFLYL